MTARKNNPKTEWARKPNCVPGTGAGNKYDFTTHLKKVGDFIETYPMPYEDVMKVKYAAYIWAYRHKCRVRTEIMYYNEGWALHIEITNHRR